ncbi:MAG: hypothetical protein ACPGUD_06625 [Parashewanella sp.]
MINVLLFSAASFWVDVQDKEALVCDINSLNGCISQLPDTAQKQLPQRPKFIVNMMQQQHAMVLPLDHSSVAGVVVLSGRHTPDEMVSFIGTTELALPLHQQAKLSLWHEIGHLENQSLQHLISSTELSEYQHEWLADIYVLWRSTKEYNHFDLAWQQYHRRNLAVINEPSNVTHWSSPYLLQVLNQYTPSQVANFSSYQAFAEDCLPKISMIGDERFRELASLLNVLFGSNTTTALPEYLYWRRPELARYLKPTLLQVLGIKRSSAIIDSLNL